MTTTARTQIAYAVRDTNTGSWTVLTLWVDLDVWKNATNAQRQALDLPFVRGVTYRSGSEAAALAWEAELRDLLNLPVINADGSLILPVLPSGD